MAEIEPVAEGRLRAACGNDEALYQRVLPYAGLIREDSYGQPVVVPAGHVYVTAGQERRATGTHYTPRSLTEPIVRHTLEPQVYEGPAEGASREDWRLKDAADLLALKVCDMAMGSGAFLVQACRYLSERLVEAWERRETNLSRRHSGAQIRITAESDVTEEDARAIPLDPDDRLRMARRLVADRCLYGVDKNPMAVEMAKLSLWLVTMEKDRPFSFLDHSLRCGDSLVGMSVEQLQYWTLHPEPGSAENSQTFGVGIEVEKAAALRREIARMPELDIRDQQAKAYQLAQAEAITQSLRDGADLLAASYLGGLKAKAAQTLRDALWRTFRQGEDAPANTPDLATCVPGGIVPFHWELEFPEVFGGDGAGFDAIVGNPPFMGGRRIRQGLGERYRDYLDSAFAGSSGNADLCAFFYLRAFRMLNVWGTFGLLATNTIAQGDTRETGLGRILNDGGWIYRAMNDQPWPGTAAVSVDVVHVANERNHHGAALDGEAVERISSFLDTRAIEGRPRPLQLNAGLAHMGTNVVGTGFMMSPEEARDLIATCSDNSNVLAPYITGEDLNSDPSQQPSRWIINFHDWPLTRQGPHSWQQASPAERRAWVASGFVPCDYPGLVASDYPQCLNIVRRTVKPMRDAVRRRNYRKYWWQHAERQDSLYRAIEALQFVFAVAQTSKYLAVAMLPKGYVYAMMTIVFATDSWSIFAVLASSLHEAWTRANSSTLETRLRYTPSDVVEPFPFPDENASCGTLGEAFHEHRRQVMLARQEGLTATYNRFHDPDETAEDIARLRALHVEMDNAVAAAYGWTDLDLGHDYHETRQGLRYTISPATRDVVLDRLLALNQERYEEEVRQGLHGEMGKRRQGRLM